MDDDIVTRLRYSARTCNHGFPNGAGDSFPDPTYCGGCLRLSDAADEIERLRSAGDALYAWITVNATTVQQQRLTYDRVMAQWEEARRG